MYLILGKWELHFFTKHTDSIFTNSIYSLDHEALSLQIDDSMKHLSICYSLAVVRTAYIHCITHFVTDMAQMCFLEHMNPSSFQKLEAPFFRREMGSPKLTRKKGSDYDDKTFFGSMKKFTSSQYLLYIDCSVYRRGLQYQTMCLKCSPEMFHNHMTLSIFNNQGSSIFF